MIHIDLSDSPSRMIDGVMAPMRIVLEDAWISRFFHRLFVLTLLAIVCSAFMTYRLSVRERLIDVELRAVRSAADSLGSAVINAAELREHLDRLDGRLAAMGKLEADPLAFVRLMGSLAGVMPLGVWIDELMIDGFNSETGEIEFRVRGYAPTMDAVELLRRLLRDSESLAEANVESTSTIIVREIPMIRFGLIGRTGRDRLPNPGYALEQGGSVGTRVF